jgi:glycerol kinase
MKAILALDQGTTGSTALVIGDDGSLLGRGYREITQHFPAPGEVEHDPDEIFRVTVEAAREALAQSSVSPVAIGITNQRETVCVWERDSGKPLHRAIVWQDRRTAARCTALAKSRDGAAITRRTGLVLDPYFSATKIEWLLRNVKGLARRAKAGDVVFGTHRYLARPPPDRGRRIRDGSHQCVAHDAVRHRSPAVGSGFATALRRAGGFIARDSCVEW